jgi:hypothetical protein
MLTQMKALELEQRIKIQQDRIRRMEYQTMGMLNRIILDADAGAACPEAERTAWGRRITFMNAKYPLALSEDGADLLFPAGLPKELPRIPDPRHPGRSFMGEKIPYLDQLWQERASGRTVAAGRNWLVFRPIETIELRNQGFFSGSCWPKLCFRADYSGNQGALLLDMDSGAAHIIGGLWLPDVRVRAMPGAMRPVFQT